MSSSTSTATPQSTDPKEALAVKEALALRIKNGEDVLFHVGKLGKDYQDWIHTTRVQKPLRFFENDFLEQSSKCPWWTVPIFWTPIITYLLCQTAYGPMETLSRYAMGVLGWPLLEYLLHRFVFHMHTETYWWNTFHFIMHGNHHVAPNDNLRLVFPPAPASIITSVIASGVYTLAGLELGHMLVAGLLTGYIGYDMVHYSLHSSAKIPVWTNLLAGLKMHHFKHHRALYAGFGITSQSIDTVFGTTYANNSKAE